MFSPIISGTIYILDISCVSGDEIQIAIHRREDIVPWLKKLNHEGANWNVVQHVGNEEGPLTNDFHFTDTVDLTDEIMREYVHCY